MNNLLFIGLNGYAGSGKDTVAKMLSTILSKDWENIDQAKEYYFSTYKNVTQPATYKFDDNNIVKCIAYADQLKLICSNIFGIPLNRFYMNKSNLWINISDKFQFTEIKPAENNIVTAEEYYYLDYNNKVVSDKWMSLREILVYVGTYVLQLQINKNIFVNIVNNIIDNEQKFNDELKYVIITDNRFNHELEYMHNKNGITLSIIRNSIEQLSNVAEHDLDGIDDFDYIIDNSNTYNDLFQTLWDLIHNNLEFQNITYSLCSYENINNYLRLVEKTNDYYIFKLCLSYPIEELYKSNGEITGMRPKGGDIIEIDEPINITNHNIQIIPKKIEMANRFNNFLIYTKIEDVKN